MTKQCPQAAKAQNILEVYFMDIEKIQTLLKEEQLDGWLFTDFHGHDFISREMLALTDRACTRRLFYYIPAQGTPQKLLSAIEPLLLDHLPGELHLYKGIAGQRRALKEILHPGQKIACQYSPGGNVPTVSTVDAGLLEYLREFQITPVSSADLLQHFGAVLTDAQIESHRQAGVIIHRILNKTFHWIRQSLDEGEPIDEWALLEQMKKYIAAEDIYMDSPPFFGIDEHGSDPGYEPTPQSAKPICEGSRLIIDIAGRLPGENTIYYDISWCMNVGPDIDPEYKRLFHIVNDVRRRILSYIQERLNAGQNVRGCDVDALAQSLLKDANLSEYIMHRTGHNIGHTCHGIGANLDDYETHDDRRLLPGTMFSVEPGVYTKRFGVRLEYDVHITPDRKLKIYGPVQDEILVI